MQFIKTIYVAHPYGNKPENKADVERIILALQKKYPFYLFISPVHCFSFEYTANSYEYGIIQCIGLLALCDEVWAFGDPATSTGMQMEYVADGDIGLPWIDGQKMLDYDVVSDMKCHQED